MLLHAFSQTQCKYSVHPLLTMDSLLCHVLLGLGPVLQHKTPPDSSLSKPSPPAGLSHPTNIVMHDTKPMYVIMHCTFTAKLCTVSNKYAYKQARNVCICKLKKAHLT